MDASKSLIVVYDVVTKSFMFPEDILPEDKFLFECHIDQIKEDLEVYSKYKAPIAYFLEVASDDIKTLLLDLLVQNPGEKLVLLLLIFLFKRLLPVRCVI